MVFKAGKHIMCEKPLTSNAAEAAELAQLSKETDKVAMEAFHYRYHPATQRAKEIVDSDEIGPLKSVNVYLSIPVCRCMERKANHKNEKKKKKIGNGFWR